ncbi:DUF1963 domain-containing protein [Tenacibaculum tangerinum]|uniref:DUF1963 domain-containing protein n=1 Tax=Tenacibaculum tangerinum TaxID=3038772 RepID=A0ABY8L599_9FLAO|nr:DUF1963 domain-containing protein [Tenacibaculum tangerinum]WGH75797.1 DUF1963 domain-containing protein [Tenacibaculum tangerinum]
MIPEFLKEFEEDLKKHEREVIRIKAEPRKEAILEDKLNLKDSKFLGIPFYPKNKKYPRDKKEKPMIMVAQLNFEQIPALEYFPKEGILQLFLSPTDWYDEDATIIYHSKEELNQELLEDFSFIAIEDYEEMPIYKLHQLFFEKDIDKGGSEDSQFDFLFNGESYWSFTENLNETQETQFHEYFDASGHKIGGYAEFTQADPRDYTSENKEDIQLLQIDTDEHIMFGDSGLGHIFISRESLRLKDFSKAYFYWDCC